MTLKVIRNGDFRRRNVAYIMHSTIWSEAMSVQRLVIFNRKYSSTTSYSVNERQV